MAEEIFIKGFIVSLSLIVAIGAQNAYILKLGLLKQHVFKAVMFCVIIDASLITVGVLGLGLFVQGNQLLINGIAIFGILFLTGYALLSFKAAFKNESLQIDDEVKTNPVKEVMTLLVMFTFLNPHVYLDTILLIGGIGANIQKDLQLYFLLGAAGASAFWFFLLGYGARVLIPLFKKPITWKILDISIGILMLVIAYSLIDLIKI